MEKKKDNRAVDADGLRARAERRAQAHHDIEILSPSDANRALHELRVHQIELEMQNEELRRAQSELEMAQEQYVDLYDRAPVGYCTISEGGRVLKANLTVATLLGVGRGALVEQPISRFIFKEDQDIYYLLRKRLFETHEPQTCELRMMKQDGTAFWAQLSAAAAQDDDGVPVSRVVISDITKRREAEETLQKNERRLRLALHAAKMATWDWDIATGAMSWDDAFYNMLGYEVGTVKPSYDAWTDRIHADDLKTTEAAIRLAIKDGNEYSVEFRACWPDGTVRWQGMLGAFDRNAGGQPIRAYGVMHDITQGKEDRRHIQELNNALKAHVATVDAMNKELESYSHSVSHDLRTPLRFVNRIAHLLLHEPDEHLSKAATEQVNMILQATGEMGNLIEDLLAFSQVSQGPMTRHLLDLGQLFQEAAKQLGPMPEDRSVEIQIQELAPCQGDRTLLKEVAVNLLANALKFTRRCEKAHITVGYIEEDGEMVYFVQDNGVGFDMNNSDALFVPFHRLHSRSEFEGIGIGLSLVRRVIERHGGRIWAVGEVDKGATFYFTLGKEGTQQDTARAKEYCT